MRMANVVPIAAGLIFMLSGCSGLMHSKVSGVVREAGSGRPIPGAVVAVRWTTYGWGTVCFHAQSGISDENGRYDTEQTKRLFGPGNVSVPPIEVYKRGYIGLFRGLEGMTLEAGNDWIVYKGVPNPAL